MKWNTLIQHLELVIIYQESPLDANYNKVILDVYPITKGNKKKTNKQPIIGGNKQREKE
jgi:hypothetical protein